MAKKKQKENAQKENAQKENVQKENVQKEKSLKKDSSKKDDLPNLIVAESAKRLFAFLVDTSIITLFIMGLAPLFYPDQWFIDQEGLTTSLTPLYILGFILFLFKDSIGGKSLGKRFLNLQITRTDQKEAPPSIQVLVLRNLFSLLLPVEAYYLVTDQYCQRLGDKYFKTFVTEKVSKPHIRSLTVKVVAVMLMIATLWMLITLTSPYAIKKNIAYQIALQAIQNSPEVREKFGEIQSVGYWPELNFEGENILVRVVLEGPEKQKVKVQAALEKRGQEIIFRQIILLQDEDI